MFFFSRNLCPDIGIYILTVSLDVVNFVFRKIPFFLFVCMYVCMYQEALTCSNYLWLLGSDSAVNVN